MDLRISHNSDNSSLCPLSSDILFAAEITDAPNQLREAKYAPIIIDPKVEFGSFNSTTMPNHESSVKIADIMIIIQ